MAEIYAVEAMRLLDHYRFRAAQKDATDVTPLTLRGPGANWAGDYYAASSDKYLERTLLAGAG